LPHTQGAGHEAVALHCESLTIRLRRKSLPEADKHSGCGEIGSPDGEQIIKKFFINSMLN